MPSEIRHHVAHALGIGSTMLPIYVGPWLFHADCVCVERNQDAHQFGVDMHLCGGGNHDAHPLGLAYVVVVVVVGVGVCVCVFMVPIAVGLTC